MDRIKIDRGFVQDIHLHDDLAKISSALINMAHSLGITSLAEGVEKVEERIVLGAFGCKYIQGYGVARPMEAEAVPAWIAKSQKKKSLPMPGLKQAM